MPPVLRRLPLDDIVPVVVAGTIVAFAAGSSSVAQANHAGKPLRWVLLFLLAASALAWAAEHGELVRVPLLVLASGAAFVGLALLSSAWSVDAKLSVARAISLAVLFVTAAALASTGAARVQRVLAAILAGAGIVAVLGLVVLAFDHTDAVQSATYDVPFRFRGIGENPNTVPLLLALVLPIGAWFALTAARARLRLASLALVLLFCGEIVASGSRGALAAGFAGIVVVLVLAPLRLRPRVAAAAVAAVLLGASLGGGELPEPTGVPPAPTAQPVPGKTARYVDVERALPLSFDIGNDPRSGAPAYGHGLFGSSGRFDAWRGAFHTAQQRPALGHGFGTEPRVFVDRYALFEGGTPEDSYLGLDLQLGAVGVALFALLASAIVVGAARGRRRPTAAVCLAVFVAGLALAIGQSYVYSVGNIGTATLWICGFAAAAREARPRA